LCVEKSQRGGEIMKIAYGGFQELRVFIAEIFNEDASRNQAVLFTHFPSCFLQWDVGGEVSSHNFCKVLFFLIYKTNIRGFLSDVGA
jgi:hypothetical protein